MGSGNTPGGGHGHDDDDEDDDEPDQPQSWFAGGERRYVFCPMLNFIKNIHLINKAAYQ